MGPDTSLHPLGFWKWIQSSQRFPSFGWLWYPTCACASCCAEAGAGSDAKMADRESKPVCPRKPRRESMSDLRPSFVNHRSLLRNSEPSHRKSLSVLLLEAFVLSKLVDAPLNLVRDCKRQRSQHRHAHAVFHDLSLNRLRSHSRRVIDAIYSVKVAMIWILRNWNETGFASVRFQSGVQQELFQ
jgi:hypothetical protein